MIVAKDAAGDSSYNSNVVVATTYLLPSPTSVSATPLSASEIDLSWVNSISDATAVNVLRSTDGQNFDFIASLAGGSSIYSDQGLSESTVYFYQVQEVLGSETSGMGAAAAETLPAGPASLVATASGADVNLAWVNASQSADGFVILRSIDDSNFEKVAWVDSTTFTYDDAGAPDGTTDYYQVRAFNLDSESIDSNVASATPVAPLRLTDDTAIPAWAQSRVNYTVAHGHTLTVVGAGDGVLANDTDPNGHTLQIASHTQPAHGALTLNSDGTFAYTANSGFIGTDTFTYTATDDLNATSNTATVSINVTDQMPEAYSQMIDLPAHFDDTLGYGGYGGYSGSGYDYSSQSVSGTLFASDADSDPLTYSASQPASGTLSLNSATGHFTYTPAFGVHSTVIITFTASDGVKPSN